MPCSGDINRDLYDIYNESFFTSVVNKTKYSLPFSPMPSPQSSLLPGHGNCVLCSEMRPNHSSGYPGKRNLDSSRMSHSVSHNSFGLQAGGLRLQKAGLFHWFPVQSLIKVSQQRHCLLLQPIEITALEINGKFFLKRCLWEMYHPPPISGCLRWMFSFWGVGEEFQLQGF